MEPTVRGNQRPRVCASCGQPLTALRALRRDVCERPACLQQHDANELSAAKAESADALRRQQVGQLGADRAATLKVLWIAPHEAQLTGLPDDLREQQRAYLFGLADGDGADGWAPAGPAPQAGPLSNAEAALCGWCGGRCCRFGGLEHGYLKLAHLRRWQLDHPGSTLQEAAEVYAQRMPLQHVATSCMYHGPQGCALDRSMRSEVCNRFACDGLRELQVQLGGSRDAGAGWLFVQARRAQAQATHLFLQPGADTDTDADAS